MLKYTVILNGGICDQGIPVYGTSYFSSTTFSALFSSNMYSYKPVSWLKLRLIGSYCLTQRLLRNLCIHV